MITNLRIDLFETLFHTVGMFESEVVIDLDSMLTRSAIMIANVNRGERGCRAPA